MSAGGNRVKFQHTLRHYEKELTAALLKDAPHSLLTLTVRAHGSGLISAEVRRQLESLDSSVPHHLMCRFLLLHVHKNIDLQGKFDRLIELLSTFEVASYSDVFSLVRRYESLENKDMTDSEEVFVIFEFHVPALTEMLAEYSYKWKEIATALWLTNNKIENIIASNSKPILSLKEVLLSWVVGECKNSKPPTLQNLKGALRNQTVGLGNVANTLVLGNVVADQGKPDCKVEDSDEDFQIISHKDDCVNVTEGSSVLLGIQVSGNYYEVKYQWTKKSDHNFVSVDESEYYSHCNESILYISAKDVTIEGHYRCMVTWYEQTDYEYYDEYEREHYMKKHGKHNQHSEPILVIVHTPLDQYKSIIISNYIRFPEIPEDTWPQVNTNSFINLALIKQKSFHKAGIYGHCTIRGDMDDIYKDKESITYDKALGGLSSGAYLLIEGRPGSGKTTLVHKFSRDWSRNEITMKHVKLLFFIHLRGFCSDPNIGLCDLIGCYFSCSDVEVIEKYANKSNGLGLCFVLDGLDEYIPQRKDVYIYKLIKKKVLPRSVVIVASRPAAAHDFRRGATRQIEVLGFLRDQIYDYIENYTFTGPSKSLTGLIKYLGEHPNVLHMCYLPIHTCMVCYLYDNLELDLPQTETSIYAEFTKFTMLRMLYRDDSNSDMYIESINDLPEPQNQLYSTICKLAFEMTSSSKQVMKQAEVKHFLKLQADKDFMGFITVDKMAMMSGFQKLYTFLHLTFQEFLAAFYISSLGEKKQLELIEQFGGAIQMKQVWKFYCGLDSTNSTFIIKLISQSCYGTPSKIQYSFESQQPCTCDSVVENSSLMFKDHFFTSSDFTAIAYVMSNTQHQCVRKVVFNKCTIGIEGVDILSRKACNKLSLVTTLCYHGYDCVTEQLSVVNRLMHLLPCLEILDVSITNLGPAEVDALTGSLNHPNLQIVKVGSRGNPLYSSPDLPLLLAKRFSSGCSKLVNVCFSGNSEMSLPESFPFSFYFYSDLPHLNMFFIKLRPLELQILLDSRNCIELYLTGCGIEDNTASILAQGLIQCTNLEILDLSCNRIGDKGAIPLARSVQYCQNLRKLNLTLNRIGCVGYAVTSAAKCNVDFHTLTFSGCCIGDSGVESLSHFIDDSKALSTETVQYYSGLHVLDISSNNISCHGAVVLSNCLKDSVETLKYLLKLDISYNKIGSDGANAIADVLNHCCHLEELIVSHNNLKEEGAYSIARSLCHFSHSLRKLDVSYNKIESAGCKTIAKSLLHCVKLRELNISFNTMNIDSAIALAEVLKNCDLYKFDISYNNIGNDGSNVIAAALNNCTQLEELNISTNHIGEDGASVLACTIFNYEHCLRKLGISNNSIGSNGANAIADALKHCTHLEELAISHNTIRNEGACIIANTFKQYAKTLYKVNMSNNHISSEGCKYIAEVLKQCVNLKELDLSYNFLNDSDAIVLSRALRNCTSLSKLNIRGNTIGSDAYNLIGDLLLEVER